jgi:hypothetical protein
MNAGTSARKLLNHLDAIAISPGGNGWQRQEPFTGRLTFWFSRLGVFKELFERDDAMRVQVGKQVLDKPFFHAVTVLLKVPKRIMHFQKWEAVSLAEVTFDLIVFLLAYKLLIAPEAVHALIMLATLVFYEQGRLPIVAKDCDVERENTLALALIVHPLCLVVDTQFLT